MAPKKEVDESISLLGRFGTSLKIGIVGLPNVGKSTFFNILTKCQVSAENYPFCTIDPNESRVAVPDERFDFLVSKYKPNNHVPAYLNVVDIAGLVQGASNGEGLGNAFLSNIKACDGIFHMIRIFEEEHVVHVSGDVNPIRDIEVIMEELRLKDIEYLNARLVQIEKPCVRNIDKAKQAEFECLKKVETVIFTNKKHLRTATEWDSKEVDILNQHLFITAKPMIYLVNMSKNDYLTKKNKWLGAIKKWVDENDLHATIIPFSTIFENELQNNDSNDPQLKSALPRIIYSGYKALQLQYFFTAGKDEVKAWTVQKGTKAPQAAGKIHTDFEKGFITAEVMAFDDFKEGGCELAVKSSGKYRQEGRNYVVKDGDIIFFKFNAPNPSSKKK